MPSHITGQTQQRICRSKTALLKLSVAKAAGVIENRRTAVCISNCGAAISWRVGAHLAMTSPNSGDIGIRRLILDAIGCNAVREHPPQRDTRGHQSRGQ